MKKLAVFFPGVGYTTDRPLLHYSMRIAAGQGYEIKRIRYAGFPEKIKGDRKKMVEAFYTALRQAEDMLAGVDLKAYDDILFVGKSVGTIVAARIASESAAADRIRLILYTPLEDTFRFCFGKAIAYTGADDPWVGAKDSRIPQLCKERQIPCTVIDKADHSLESGNVQEDIQNLQAIMEGTEAFVRSTGQTAP